MCRLLSVAYSVNLETEGLKQPALPFHWHVSSVADLKGRTGNEGEIKKIGLPRQLWPDLIVGSSP